MTVVPIADELSHSKWRLEDPNMAAMSTGDATATRYYTFAGSTFAVRPSDGQPTLVLGDEQGSTYGMMLVTVLARWIRRRLNRQPGHQVT